MSRRNPWPALIVALIVGFLALTAWSFHRAARDASIVTDSDYYNHGLRFEQTRLEQKTAASLGWVAETSLHDRQLIVRLKDRQQQPIATGRAELILSGGNRGETLRLPLTEDTRGSYRVQLPATLRGEQSARVDFEHDGARLSKQLILALP